MQKILVVEDDREMNQGISYVLEEEGYRTISAHTITEGRDAYEKNGEITSATGVTGKKYFAQIQNSTTLSEEERKNALAALEQTLQEMRKGEVVDFRMTIRGEQRAYHSESRKISGRAKELYEKMRTAPYSRKSYYGFPFLPPAPLEGLCWTHFQEPEAPLMPLYAWEGAELALI